MTSLYVLILAVGAAALGALLLYRHGKKVQRQGQDVSNLKEHIDARKRADDAVDAVRADDGMSDVDSKLRQHGAVRD